MVFCGDMITVSEVEAGLLVLTWDAKQESVNKFDRKTVAEFRAALGAIQQVPNVRALVAVSAKTGFIVGADVTEFTPAFRQGAQAIRELVVSTRDLFNEWEDLPFPTVVAINGYALGGGCEFCLACDYRLMSQTAKMGLPETKLGILPGWGGTVRLPRIVGVDTAIEWIASGQENSADEALKAGAVDAVLAPDALYDAALATARRLAASELDYHERRAQKKAPLAMNDMESLLAFESAKAFVAGKAGRNYPAPVKSIKTMQEAAKLERAAALEVETAAFCKLAETAVARALVGLFLSDQYIGKKAKQLAQAAEAPLARAAVLGAGIMGGGIAYQSAQKGIPITMKDIAQAGLDLGLQEAAKLLGSRVERGKMTAAEMAEVLNRIDPALSFDGFDQADVVVEAVVENPKVKKSVLAEAETHLKAGAVLASNTSTISIDYLAAALKSPDRFCGMHFFNPVHAMPLVEVIRGQHTSDATVAKVVSYALAMGKKAIVVRDCPGFLVNRVLFPYFAGFAMLLRDGARFEQIDAVMEQWGWPMGPAYLLDVVGIDTGVHAETVMAQGFPDRLSQSFKACTQILFEAGRLGQKNGRGFYNYAPDKKGKPQKVAAPEVAPLLAPHCAPLREVSEAEIIARMMIPMVTELCRCLDEGIVDSAMEADMALVYGLGFPPFRGGLLRWLDEIGLAAFVDMAKPWSALGPLYQVPDSLLALAQSAGQFYPKV